MSQRNGDRSRTNAQKRHKAKMRVKRRELANAPQKVVSITSKKAAAKPSE